MSAYIIIKKSTSHPLDAVWSAATEALSDASAALDALGSDFTDEQIDAAADVRSQAISVIQALPARNIDDVLVKLDAARCEADDHVVRTDCSLAKISDELCDAINDALRPVVPEEPWAVALAAYLAAEKRDVECGPGDPDEDSVNQTYWAAAESLIKTPAPDHGALKTKLELLRELSHGQDLTDERYELVIADVCRLGGLAVPA